MKILIVSHTYIVELNREKLRELAKLEPNIEVTIIIPKIWQPGGVQNKIIESKEFSEGNFRVIPVNNFSKNNQGLLTFNWQILRILKNFKPDIIQVEQGVKSLAYAQFITINKILNLKAKNVFFTWWNLPYQNKFPINLLEQYNLQNTHGLIVGNQDGLDILRDHGYQKEAIILPQLGIDANLFYPQKLPELKAKIGLENDKITIGFVGRFVPEKGIITLLKALNNITELPWQLLLLGRGELEAEIRKFCLENNLENRVKIIASVPHKDVAKYINLMDILVLPSETSYNFKTLTSVGWKEQFGHVIIEAMACKVPVIGSNSGEIPHVIEDTGLIFNEGDISELKTTLKTLIENPQLREKLGQKGYQKCLQQYTNKALAQKQFNFYQQILNQNNS